MLGAGSERCGGSVVKAELLYGARKSARVSDNLVRGAIDSLAVDDLAVDGNAFARPRQHHIARDDGGKIDLNHLAFALDAHKRKQEGG